MKLLCPEIGPGAVVVAPAPVTVIGRIGGRVIQRRRRRDHRLSFVLRVLPVTIPRARRKTREGSRRRTVPTWWTTRGVVAGVPTPSVRVGGRLFTTTHRYR